MSDAAPPELLRKLLRYESDTGLLFWRERSVDVFTDGKFPAEHKCNLWNSRWSGAEAFTCVTDVGYKHGAVFAKQYKAHRVIWAMQTGAWPVDEIDHINHDRADNRIENLRVVTSRENSQNRSLRDDNTSGYVGVCRRKYNGKYQASISDGGKRKTIGTFNCITAAAIARSLASIKCGYHENHGEKLA